MAPPLYGKIACQEIGESVSCGRGAYAFGVRRLVAALQTQPATRRTVLQGNCVGAGSSVESRREVRRLERVSEASPGIESAGKRTGASDPTAMEKLRRTGAAGLVRSGAVEHDVAILGDLAMPLLDLFGFDVDGARQAGFVRLQIEFVAEVNDE